MKYLDKVQLINSVEIRTNRLLDANQQNYIKQKLLEVYSNSPIDYIFVVTRGEGRNDRVQSVLDGEYFFNWGIKSYYSYVEELKIVKDKKVNANEITENFLYEPIDKIRNTFRYYIDNKKGYNIKVSDNSVDKLVNFLQESVKDISDEF